MFCLQISTSLWQKEKMLFLNAVSASVSIQNVIYTSTSPISLEVFPLPENISLRRAESACTNGTEWRLARLGDSESAACSCPPNPVCIGPISCKIVPNNGEIWYIRRIPTTTCYTTAVSFTKEALSSFTTPPFSPTTAGLSLNQSELASGGSSQSTTNNLYMSLLVLLLPMLLVGYFCQQRHKKPVKHCVEQESFPEPAPNPQISSVAKSNLIPTTECENPDSQERVTTGTQRMVPAFALSPAELPANNLSSRRHDNLMSKTDIPTKLQAPYLSLFHGKSGKDGPTPSLNLSCRSSSSSFDKQNAGDPGS